jgi:single-strand DNA-binding protein
MKNITIAGRLTRDAEQRRTQNGDAVLSFSVAVDDRSTKEKRSLFFDCSMWGQRGAAVAGYLKKGNNVTVSGDLSTREHDSKTYLTVRVNDLTLQGGERSKQDQSAAPTQSSYAENSGSRPDLGDDPDSIPF